MRHLRLGLLVSGICCVAGVVGLTPLRLDAATITIVNLDGPGEGFNDPTPVPSVGGNTGATRGAQRLLAFQQAAAIWGALLNSVVEIKVGANFDPLECHEAGDEDGDLLGEAGPCVMHRDFAGAPVANTWYGDALADSLAGVDLAPGSNDIKATFNSDWDTTNCPRSCGWYYGLDSRPPESQEDLVTIVLHELGHGLNFLSMVDDATGAKFMGRDDTYMLNLEDHSLGLLYPAMTNAQRVTAAIDTGDLHWVGADVVGASPRLTAGRHAPSGHVQMFAPNPLEEGSSVSHFDTALAPDELMEPYYTVATHDVGLALELMSDVGWSTNPCAAGCDDHNPCTDDSCDSVAGSFVCQHENNDDPCDDGSRCTVDDTCDEGRCVGTVNLQTCHFQCYEVKPTRVTAGNVNLDDEFGSACRVDVQRPERLCAPADKNDEDPTAPDEPEHLMGYRVRAPFLRRTNQLVVDQFGSLRLDVKRRDRLFVPAHKSFFAPPSAPTDPEIDHFNCYRVARTVGTPAFVPRSATVDDQFGSAVVTLKRPLRLCAPVNKRGEDSQASGRPDHLLCYRTGRVPFATLSPFTNDQFGPRIPVLIRRMEFCVPALLNP